MTLPAMPPADAHGVEALAVLEPVDLDGRRLVGGEPVERRRELVHGVRRPPSCAPSARARRRRAVRRGGCRCSRPRRCEFEGSPRIAKSPVNRSGRFRASRPSPLSSAETSSWSYHIHVMSTAGSTSSAAQLQLHGDARLHVDGAAPPEVALAVDGLEPRRQVAVDRHGVEVPGDHDAALPAEVRARHDRVAVADHLEVVGPREGLDHEVGQPGLVARHARHVADRLRDRHRVGGEVERWHGRGGSRHATSLRIRVRPSRAGATDDVTDAARHRPADTLDACPPTDTASSPARRAAWGHGLATVAADGTVLDTWYPAPALGAPPTTPASPVELRTLAGRDDRRAVVRASA